jgi:hypothetical protein
MLSAATSASPEDPTSPATIPNSHPLSAALVRSKIRPSADYWRSVQNAVAADAVSHRCIDLLKFGFKLLVDQQQSFQRATDVAIAAGYNLVDGGIVRFGKHHGSSTLPWTQLWRSTGVPVDSVDNQATTASIERARNMAKVLIILI